MIPLALIAGTVMALGALAFVLAPLFMDVDKRPPVRHPEHVSPEETNAVATLREIEFDRVTGKLSDADYASLKERYTRFAVEALRAKDAKPEAAATSGDDARLLSLTECTTCGPRPESDAIYCSACGKFLGGPCSQCGALVDQPGARYCPGCGHAVAA